MQQPGFPDSMATAMTESGPLCSHDERIDRAERPCDCSSWRPASTGWPGCRCSSQRRPSPGSWGWNSTPRPSCSSTSRPGVIVVFGGVYAMIARDPVRYRVYIPLGIILKIWVVPSSMARGSAAGFRGRCRPWPPATFFSPPPASGATRPPDRTVTHMSTLSTTADPLACSRLGHDGFSHRQLPHRGHRRRATRDQAGALRSTSTSSSRSSSSSG